MFGTIRKHQQWLWVIIVSAMILSFVIFFSPNQPSLRSIRSGGELGVVDGLPLTSPMWIAAQRQAQIRRFLYQGDRATGDLEREAVQDLFLDAKIRTMGIEVDDESVASWVKQRLREPRSGQLMYDGFVRELQSRGISEHDFIEFIRGEVARQHLVEVAGTTSKLVPPREAEAEFRRDNEQAVVSVVAFSLSNFLATVKVDPAAVGQFYSNRVAAYRTPERVQVNFVRFDRTNHLAEAAKELGMILDLTNRMEQAYTQRGAEAFRGKDGNVLDKSAALASLYEQERDGLAVRAAQQKAAEFYNELAAMEPAKPENLATLAAAKGVALNLSQPFSQFGVVPGLEDIQQVGQESFKLSAETPFTMPLAGEKGVVIVALKQRYPSEIQPLEQVRSRVIEDYKRNQAFDMVRTTGTKFHAAATNGMAHGKDFAAIAKEQGHTAVELAPFTLNASTLPDLPARIDLGSLKNSAFALKPGAVSEFIYSRDGGMVVFLKEKRPVDDAKVKAELPAYLADARKQNSMAGFYEWFAHEFDKSGLQRLLRKSEASTGAPEQTP